MLTSSIMHPRKLARGFTLIELLVVVAIIVTLISILMPSLSNARAHARATVCASNLRSLGLAVEMYKSENDGYYVPAVEKETYKSNLTTDLPAGKRWFNWLEPYTKSYAVMNCPDQNMRAGNTMVIDRAGMTVPGWNNAWGPIPRGRSAAGGSCNYAYNTTNVGGSVDKNNIRKYAGVEASIAGASKQVPVTNTVVIMDGVFFVSTANGAYPQSSSYELFWPYHFMHLDKANTLFLDGHVSGLRYQQFYLSQGTWSTATGFALVGRD